MKFEKANSSISSDLEYSIELKDQNENKELLEIYNRVMKINDEWYILTDEDNDKLINLYLSTVYGSDHSLKNQITVDVAYGKFTDVQ